MSLAIDSTYLRQRVKTAVDGPVLGRHVMSPKKTFWYKIELRWVGETCSGSQENSQYKSSGFWGHLRDS